MVSTLAVLGIREP
ncbi:Protein of unknown function [Pyronema omphalodes CBS 100304]|uniref:Uncharacterized protein n=1 Tax=Pyronema omphalodes (strain CBS 100304) TaxID=1076935 RepID=U4L090_PYROM|nr:Protein of unknown function [Pyronema omphalodes CBS 100304]